MPVFEIELTDEQVEDLREWVIRQMPRGTPKDPKGFIEWWLNHTLEHDKRQVLMEEVAKMSPNDLRSAIEMVKKGQLQSL